MIITYKKYGRLANRLFLLAHLVAFSDRYSVSLRNFFFREYARFFPYWAGMQNCRYPANEAREPVYAKSLALLKGMSILGALPSVRFWDERDVIFDGEDADDSRVRLMRSCPVVIFEGWKLRSRDTILRMKPFIRQAFSPTSQATSVVSDRLLMARSRGDKVVGVHVRWEDYRGTDWYFPLNEYLSHISWFSSALRPHKAVYLILSPESLESSLFPKSCIICTGQGPIEDLYTLAACDYILGPPSTFSGWASFYGERPIAVMRKGENSLRPEALEAIKW